MPPSIPRIQLCLVLIGAYATGAVWAADPANTCDPDALQDSGAVYRICMPPLSRWNGDLVVFAHGYVEPNRPIEIPEEQLGVPGGLSLPQLANLLGYGFAVSSYSTNGLAVRQGLDDLVDLVDIFIDTYSDPDQVYLLGASEGGLITTLGVERHPDVFDGGLATCGPISDFRQQLDYFADFRVVFDYFFPEVIPGSAMDIPPEVAEDWSVVYAPLIEEVISSDPVATEQLLRVTGAPTDRRDPTTVAATVIGLLWYNVHATNDAVAKLGGISFDNQDYRYRGSHNPTELNRTVERFSADVEALMEIELYYQTSGELTRPLVTLHTTGDPIVPFWHDREYRGKVLGNGGQAFLANIPVRRYGHCNFTVTELLVGFSLLVWEATGQELVGVDGVLPSGRSRAEFMRLTRLYGVGRVGEVGRRRATDVQQRFRR